MLTTIERQRLLDGMPPLAQAAIEATDYYQALNILKRTGTRIPDWLIDETNAWLASQDHKGKIVTVERYLDRIRFHVVPASRV